MCPRPVCGSRLMQVRKRRRGTSVLRRLLFTNVVRGETTAGDYWDGRWLVSGDREREDSGLNRRFDDVVNLPLAGEGGETTSGQRRWWSAGHRPGTEIDRAAPPSCQLSVIHYMPDGRADRLSRDEMSSRVLPVYFADLVRGAMSQTWNRDR